MTAPAQKIRSTLTFKHGVESFEDADMETLEIGRLQLQIEALEAERRLQISDIDERYAPKLKALLDEMGKRSDAVIAFAEKERSQVEGNTWKGSWATIKWPNYSEFIAWLKSEEDVIKRLKASRIWKSFVVIKESVDKNAIKLIPKRDHKKFGFELRENTDKRPILNINLKKIRRHVETRAAEELV